HDAVHHGDLRGWPAKIDAADLEPDPEGFAEAREHCAAGRKRGCRLLERRHVALALPGVMDAVSANRCRQLPAAMACCSWSEARAPCTASVSGARRAPPTIGKSLPASTRSAPSRSTAARITAGWKRVVSMNTCWRITSMVPVGRRLCAERPAAIASPP